MTGLDRLFRPRSMAAVGGMWAENVVRSCLDAGYTGTIWPVNPNRKDMCGLKCHASVDDLPGVPDCCFVGVKRDIAIKTVARLREIGTGGVVCFASGFAESFREDPDGPGLQKALLDAAGDMPLLGPNCYGLINYLDDTPIWPDVHGGSGCRRGVAIICQSSNIALNITMQSRGLEIAYVVTTGNQAMLSQAMIANALMDDDRVSAIGLYIEDLGKIRELEHLAARARDKRVPIVAIRAGTSAKARELVISHTSSISGSNATANALLERLGIGQVEDVPQLIETLKLLHVHGPLDSLGIGSMSCSGGEACIMADLVANSPLHFSDLTEEQASGLHRVLGPMVHLANPLDYHTYIWGDAEKMKEMCLAMLAGRQALTFLVIDFPRSGHRQAYGWKEAVSALHAASQITGCRTAVVASLAENLPLSWCKRLLELNIVPLCGMNEAIKAASVAARIGFRWLEDKPEPVRLGLARTDRVDIISEPDARKQLEAAGMCFPKWQCVHHVSELKAAARDIGYPVTLKGAGVIHKTECGAVRTNITNEATLLGAASDMQAPGGYLVEKHVHGAVAEVMISIRNDPATGLMLNIGSGGVLVELLKDIRHLMLPSPERDIKGTLQQLNSWNLLAGWRGSKPADIDALMATITTLCRYAEDNADSVVEIELNPYLALPDGGFVVDVLMRLQERE